MVAPGRETSAGAGVVLCGSELHHRFVDGVFLGGFASFRLPLAIGGLGIQLVLGEDGCLGCRVELVIEERSGIQGEMEVCTSANAHLRCFWRPWMELWQRGPRGTGVPVGVPMRRAGFRGPAGREGSDPTKLRWSRRPWSDMDEEAYFELGCFHTGGYYLADLFAAPTPAEGGGRHQLQVPQQWSLRAWGQKKKKIWERRHVKAEIGCDAKIASKGWIMEDEHDEERKGDWRAVPWHD